MQLGICADPATLATVPTPLTFEFIEGHVQNFLKPEATEAEFTSNLRALRQCARKMPAANCFLPADLKVTGPNVDAARLDRYVTTAFRRAQEAGMHIIVFGSAGARMVPEGFPSGRAFEQFVDLLTRIAPLAAAKGVTIAVEPLQRSECNFINTILEGAAVVERVRHPQVRLLVDIFHMARNGESPDDIVKVGRHVHHVHIAENRDRAAPGVHGEDFRAFFRALKKIGYDDLLTIEAIWQDLPRQTAPAIAELRRQLVDAGY